MPETRNAKGGLRGLVRGASLGLSALAIAAAMAVCKQSPEPASVSIPPAVTIERAVETPESAVLSDEGLILACRSGYGGDVSDREIFYSLQEKTLDNAPASFADAYKFCLDQMSEKDLYRLKDAIREAEFNGNAIPPDVTLHNYIVRAFGTPLSDSREERAEIDGGNRRDHSETLSAPDAFDGIMQRMKEYEPITPYVPYLDEMTEEALEDLREAALLIREASADAYQFKAASVNYANLSVYLETNFGSGQNLRYY